jgi:anti-anti-sigma regulatory factor
MPAVLTPVPIKPSLSDLEASIRLILRAMPPDGLVPSLTLDLCDVTTLSAGGLGQLVALHNRLADSGGLLTLVNVGRLPYGVLEVTRLTGLFEVRRAAPEGERPLLTESRRRLIFLALTEMVEKGTQVTTSRRAVAARFGVSGWEVGGIEQEGVDAGWPPLDE